MTKRTSKFIRFFFLFHSQQNYSKNASMVSKMLTCFIWTNQKNNHVTKNQTWGFWEFLKNSENFIKPIFPVFRSCKSTNLFSIIQSQSASVVYRLCLTGLPWTTLNVAVGESTAACVHLLTPWSLCRKRPTARVMLIMLESCCCLFSSPSS